MKKRINSGDLNQKIEIFKVEYVKDGFGGTSPVNISYWATFAKVDLARASRSLQALQEVLKPAINVVIRNRTDKFIEAGMLLEWRGELFTITQAEPDFVYKEFITIIAISTDLPTR